MASRKYYTIILLGQWQYEMIGAIVRQSKGNENLLDQSFSRQHSWVHAYEVYYKKYSSVCTGLTYLYNIYFCK